ncbi:MAG TPA: J domain-containing protein [Acidimicrobiia bacterium]|nr:J domain-containing protein [Acidimicrobiia bacterium]
MILAELNVRHTRRHQPTRRVALGDTYLPTSGPAYGAVLVGAVVAEFLDGLDEEQRELLPRLLSDAADGLSVPRIALRHRLQTDTHGLDRSRHRIVADGGLLTLELDAHGWPTPQVLGAVIGAAAMPASGRKLAFRAIAGAVARPGVLPEGLEVRRLLEGVPGLRPYAPGAAPRNGAGDTVDAGWRGVPAERRWAMEVLGVRAGARIDREDVQRRFRRLLRIAHPDHGAADTGAAERIAELAEARELLLAVLDHSQ